MSYDPNPAHYVNGSFIIWHLVDVVAKGGLMQIGYGPVRGGTRATRGGTDGTRVARGWYGVVRSDAHRLRPGPRLDHILLGFHIFAFSPRFPFKWRGLLRAALPLSARAR